ncbi:hypothetical protein N182_10725 [Sinorhizobium sp. GL2]|nr:hypothetical protein N182_10725 [Sinorhizobium sp. GL2]
MEVAIERTLICRSSSLRYYPENGEEGIHVGDDMAVTDAAIRTLKEEVEGIPSPAT